MAKRKGDRLNAIFLTAGLAVIGTLALLVNGLGNQLSALVEKSANQEKKLDSAIENLDDTQQALKDFLLETKSEEEIIAEYLSAPSSSDATFARITYLDNGRIAYKSARPIDLTELSQEELLKLQEELKTSRYIFIATEEDFGDQPRAGEKSE